MRWPWRARHERGRWSGDRARYSNLSTQARNVVVGKTRNWAHTKITRNDYRPSRKQEADPCEQETRLPVLLAQDRPLANTSSWRREGQTPNDGGAGTRFRPANTTSSTARSDEPAAVLLDHRPGGTKKLPGPVQGRDRAKIAEYLRTSDAARRSWTY